MTTSCLNGINFTTISRATKRHYYRTRGTSCRKFGYLLVTIFLGWGKISGNIMNSFMSVSRSVKDLVIQNTSHRYRTSAMEYSYFRQLFAHAQLYTIIRLYIKGFINKIVFSINCERFFPEISQQLIKYCQNYKKCQSLLRSFLANRSKCLIFIDQYDTVSNIVPRSSQHKDIHFHRYIDIIDLFNSNGYYECIRNLISRHDKICEYSRYCLSIEQISICNKKYRKDMGIYTRDRCHLFKNSLAYWKSRNIH